MNAGVTGVFNYILVPHVLLLVPVTIFFGLMGCFRFILVISCSKLLVVVFQQGGKECVHGRRKG